MGCGADSEPDAGSVSAPPPAVPSVLVETGTTHDHLEPLPGSVLALDAAARQEARRTGLRAMQMFARPKMSQSEWLAALAPLMTPEAQAAYGTVDPANIPVTRVSGAARVTPASHPMVARVAVPTDDGVYLVILTRTDEQPRWLVDRVMPPEGVGDAQ